MLKLNFFSFLTKLYTSALMCCNIFVWFFIVNMHSCLLLVHIACQCNGHSTCMNNTDVCIHPCSNNTEGRNCESCIKGFYGNPINGGECKGIVINTCTLVMTNDYYIIILHSLLKWIYI